MAFWGRVGEGGGPGTWMESLQKGPCGPRQGVRVQQHCLEAGVFSAPCVCHRRPPVTTRGQTGTVQVSTGRRQSSPNRHTSSEIPEPRGRHCGGTALMSPFDEVKLL